VALEGTSSLVEEKEDPSQEKKRRGRYKKKRFSPTSLSARGKGKKRADVLCKSRRKGDVVVGPANFRKGRNLTLLRRKEVRLHLLRKKDEEV